MRIAFLTSMLFLALSSPRQALAAAPSAATDELARRSLKTMYGDSAAISRSSLVLTMEDKRVLWDSSRARWQGDTLTMYRCSLHDTLAGYAFLDDVKGKVQFITMLVGVLPDGAVRDVDILVYREAYGAEVASESFRRQFRGISSSSDIRPGGTIRNISGATISARAVTFGVKKIVATYRLVAGRLPR